MGGGGALETRSFLPKRRKMVDKKAANHRLIVQPDESTELIDSAQRSLRVKQFTLTDSHVMSALIKAHHRKLDVRIMLNPHRSSGDRANDESFKALRHAGLKVEWSNPAFAVTHEKSMVVDESV